MVRVSLRAPSSDFVLLARGPARFDSRHWLPPAAFLFFKEFVDLL
jgi:hypothetical protein